MKLERAMLALAIVCYIAVMILPVISDRISPVIGRFTTIIAFCAFASILLVSAGAWIIMQSIRRH